MKDKRTREQLLEHIEHLEGFIQMDAICPCCAQGAVCEDECTFAEDCPDDVKRMESAREALKGRHDRD